MSEKGSGVLSRTALVTAVLGAAAGAAGTEAVKSWLPGLARYGWSRLTSEPTLHVAVTDVSGPVAGAEVSVWESGAERILGAVATNANGTAMLRNQVFTSDFIDLRVEFVRSDQRFLFVETVSVAELPLRVAVPGERGWFVQALERTPVIGTASGPGGDVAPIVAKDAPWLQIALGEVGVTEVAGPRHEDRVLGYLEAVGLAASGDETPWSCAFVSWVLLEAGQSGGFASARCADWADFGQPLEDPKPGALVVLEGPQGLRHAGFVVRVDPASVTLVSGNSSDAVRVAAFPRERIGAIRWPTFGE